MKLMALAIRTLRDVYLRDLQRSEGTTKIVKSYRGILWAVQLVRRQPLDGRLGRSSVSVRAPELSPAARFGVGYKVLFQSPV